MGMTGKMARAAVSSAGSLVDAEVDGRRVPMGEAGRRCANDACGKLLARMNRERLCFACQAERDDRALRELARPVSIHELLRSGSSGDLRVRRRQAG